MSNEKDDANLLDHNYDGIRELDNRLPNWWLQIFYASILFALGYWAYYHFGGPGISPEAEYERQVHELSVAQTAAPKKIDFDENDLLALAKKPEHLNAGKALFATNCVSCHAADGGGGVGPNLTDDFWIHGGKYTQVATVIRDGVPDKGMVSWGLILPDSDIKNLALFVKSLHGTKPANPKAPQGSKE